MLCYGYYNIRYVCNICNISFCDTCSILNISPIGNQQHMPENMRFCKNCLFGCLPNIAYRILWPNTDIIQWVYGYANNNHNVIDNLPVDDLVNRFTDLSIKNKVAPLDRYEQEQYDEQEQEQYDEFYGDIPDSP